MKFKSFLVMACCSSAAAYAYTQSDLLAAQYAYQSDSDKVTQAKTEKQDASAALGKAKSKLTKAQSELQQAQSELQSAQSRFNNAESTFRQTNSNFGLTNQKLNQIWNSLNPPTSPAQN